MTATVLNNKTPRQVSPALHNWKSNVKSSRKLTIMLSILHFAAMPLLLIMTIISCYTKNGGDDVDAYAVIAVATTAIAAFLGIFAATDSFRCLHDKSVVDMKLALPMNNTQRFLSDFLSGLFNYLAPFFGAQVISVLLCGYGCLFMDGKTFYRIISYTTSGSVTRPVEEPYVCDLFGEIMPILLKLIVGGTLCMLMLYVITVLITVCCGNKFEAIAYTILINVLIPLTIFCVFYSMFDSLYGIDAEEISVKAMLYVSVAGGIVATADWASQGDLLYYDAEFFNHGVWLLVFTLVIAAIFALAFFLYRKRRAEQVSKPFVFKLAYYIVISCTMFCIISLFIAENAELVPAIITTAIVYTIFEVVTNRGFKRFWLSIVKYAATCIAIVAVIFVCNKTDGFGAVQRVPSASAVKSIELGYTGFYGDFSVIYNSYNRSASTYLLKDKANIEAVVNAHQAIIDYYNENGVDYENNAYTSVNSVTITYNLKTGGSFTRSYGCYSAEPMELLSVIDLSEEYKMQVAEMYRNEILNSLKSFEAEMAVIRSSEDYETYYSHFDYTLSVFNKNPFVSSDSSTAVSLESLAERDFFPQLADAYYKDIMAINEENYFRSELKNVWYINIPFMSNSLTVPESFTNTVELLDYFDCGLVRVERLSDKELENSFIKVVTSGRMALFTEDEYREYCGVDEELALRANYDNYYFDLGNTENLIYNFDENLCQLIRASMPRNIVPENGYVINVRGYAGAIPEDLNSVAASITRSGYDENQQAYYRALQSAQR